MIMECFELRQRDLDVVVQRAIIAIMVKFFFVFFLSRESDVFKIVFRGRWF